MDPSNRKTLEKIFKIVLDLPENENWSEVRKLNHPKWDSLANVSLIAAIESEFDLKLDVADAESVSSFEAVEYLLSDKGL